jgi:hypothetical protein
MKLPNKEQTDALRKEYPAGTLVELVQMDDAYTTLKPGDRGTVKFIDDMAGCHIAWFNGSNLAVILDHDIIKKVTEGAK